jgi:hypothetical protein
MTKDVRRGELDLLPMVFQALMEFEQHLALYRHLEPKTVAQWKLNKDVLLKAWERCAVVAAAYAATCPELGEEAGT